jgi:hypothetical protein
MFIDGRASEKLSEEAEEAGDAIKEGAKDEASATR